MMEMDKALAASSMLLAIVAVIFGAWTGDLSKALSLAFPPQVLNREPQRLQIRSAIYSKALPLTVGAWFSAAVFAYRSLLIMGDTIGCTPKQCSYDDVSAAFVLTETFVIVAAISASAQLFDLTRKLRKSHQS